MGNNYCKQLGISPLHPISTQDLADVWSAYVDKDDDHLGALTPETARTFILDFAEAINIACTEEQVNKLLHDASARSKRADGRISHNAFMELFFSVVADGKVKLSESLAGWHSKHSPQPAPSVIADGADFVQAAKNSSELRKLKILFFNVPLHGHMNPTLDLVADLAKQGHEVVYYTSENFRQKVLHTGVTEFRPYPSNLDFKTTRSDTNIFHTGEEMLKAAVTLLEALAPGLASEQASALKPYDLVAYDVSAVWGKFLGYILDLPAVCCFPGLAPQWREYARSRTIITRGLRDRIAGAEFVNSSDNMLASIKSTYKVPSHMALSNLFSGSTLLNIVFTSRYFQPKSEYMTKSYIFVGPALFGGARQETVEFPWDKLDATKPLIYVSMGTLYYQDPAFFKTCFESFKDSQYQVVISVGRGTDINSLGAIPPNFIVKPYVPQPELLGRAAAFISHGGMGGISEAMHYGVPMLLLPKTIEQQLNARRVSLLGAGIDTREAQNVACAVLVDGVAKLLADKSFSENAKKIGESFASAGGVQPAIDAMEEIPNYYAKEKISNSPALVRLQSTLNGLKKTTTPPKPTVI
jgi:MGT family glycosyltransferase